MIQTTPGVVSHLTPIPSISPIADTTDTTMNTDTRIASIQEQVNFCHAPTSNYFARYRRDLVASYLSILIRKIMGENQDLDNLRLQLEAEQRARHIAADNYNNLRDVHRSTKELLASSNAALATRESLLARKIAQKNARCERLQQAVREREAEKEHQCAEHEILHNTYREKLAFATAQLKAAEAQNAKLRMLSIHAVKYISDPIHTRAFYGYLAEKGISMEFTECKRMMAEMHEMTPDQLVLAMGDGVAALLDAAPATDIPVFVAEYSATKKRAMCLDELSLAERSLDGSVCDTVDSHDYMAYRRSASDASSSEFSASSSSEMEYYSDSSMSV